MERRCCRTPVPFAPGRRDGAALAGRRKSCVEANCANRRAGGGASPIATVARKEFTMKRLLARGRHLLPPSWPLLRRHAGASPPAGLATNIVAKLARRIQGKSAGRRPGRRERGARGVRVRYGRQLDDHRHRHRRQELHRCPPARTGKARRFVKGLDSCIRTGLLLTLQPSGVAAASAHRAAAARSAALASSPALVGVAVEDGADQRDVALGGRGKAGVALVAEPEAAAVRLQRRRQPGGERIVGGRPLSPRPAPCRLRERR